MALMNLFFMKSQSKILTKFESVNRIVPLFEVTTDSHYCYCAVWQFYMV